MLALSNPAMLKLTMEVIMGRFIDLTGKRFGKLTILERGPNNNLNKITWKTLCDCGSFSFINRNELLSGDTKSCGCIRKDNLLIDLTYKKFGKLTVKSKADKKGKSSSQFWNCLCDCGNEVIHSSQHLLNDCFTSCGCETVENIVGIPEKIYKKFLKNVEKLNDCWEWKGALSKGYGIFFYTKMIKAHRFSYIYNKGKIEFGKLICHKCNNKKCVNPDHLYMGTHKDNMLDVKKANLLKVR